MGLILAGILAGALFIGGMILYMLFCKDPDTIPAGALLLLAILCVIAGFYAGITEPVSGYGDPEVFATTELVSLRDDTTSEGTGNLFYVSISGTNSYTYYVEVESAYASNSQKAYKSKTISGSNVTIVEDDSYTDAKLVIYVKYGKKSFWTFAAGAKQYEYVFYVPTGTIARDVTLN